MSTLSTEVNSSKKIALNIGWSVFDKIFRMATSMLVGVWVARYLGPAQFGLLNYAQAFPSALIAFANLGLTNILITHFVQNATYEKRDLIGTGFMLKLLSGSICYLLIVAISYFIYYDNQRLQILIYLVSSLLIFQSFEVIDMFFQAKILAKKSVWAKTLAFFISSALKFYFLINQADLSAFAFTIVVELGLSTLFLSYFYTKETGIKLTQWRFDRQLALKLLKASWPLIFSDFLIFLYMRLDQIMIQQMVGSKELGLYSAALRLSESWYFLASALTNSFYPGIAALWQSNEKIFYEQYQKLINRLAIIALSVALFVSLFSSILVRFIFGSNYDGVASILSLHVWTGIPIFLGVGCSNLYILKNIQKYTIIRSAVGATINVALNWWLIPIYGALGASAATFVSQLFASFLFNAFSNSTRPIFDLQLNALKNIIFFKFSSIR